MTIAVRRLGPDDWSAYRKLRLEALAEAPEAFGDSLEEAQERPKSYWQTLVAGERAFFGGFDGSRLVGSANLVREDGPKLRHKGWLLGMYVAPHARGTGCGPALIEAVADHARSVGVRQLHLGVGEHNDAARRLYERAGFIRYGTEPRGLKVEGRFIDEHLMIKYLDKEETT